MTPDTPPIVGNIPLRPEQEVTFFDAKGRVTNDPREAVEALQVFKGTMEEVERRFGIPRAVIEATRGSTATEVAMMRQAEEYRRVQR